jgi:hypothetical protein
VGRAGWEEDGGKFKFGFCVDGKKEKGGASANRVWNSVQVERKDDVAGSSKEDGDFCV